MGLRNRIEKQQEMFMQTLEDYKAALKAEIKKELKSEIMDDLRALGIVGKE